MDCTRRSIGNKLPKRSVTNTENNVELDLITYA